ncbi:MAG TPA: hypothetical protein VK722_00395 [Candidatus Aquilonibacter sp.]|jgi:hypothetical protein|nr:hypothetical protein [Candidatus Aquilonibacter sp.]
MTYFECFVAASWTLTIGWFAQAIYFQNRNEKVESPLLSEDSEPSPNSEVLQLPAAASAGD